MCFKLGYSENIWTLATATTWADNLSSTAFTDEVIQFLEKVLQTNPLEEDLTSLLHKFHIQQNNPLKAHETLTRYTQELLKADYTIEEASEFTTAIGQRGVAEEKC